MHDEIHEALSRLNDAISHAQAVCEKHGKDHRLECHLNALECAQQELWDAAQGEGSSEIEVDPDIIAKLDALAAASGLDRDDIARMTTGKGLQLVQLAA